MKKIKENCHFYFLCNNKRIYPKDVSPIKCNVTDVDNSICGECPLIKAGRKSSYEIFSDDIKNINIMDLESLIKLCKNKDCREIADYMIQLNIIPK